MRKSGRIIWETDDSEMVLIPAGSFSMGCLFSGGRSDETPMHEVELNPFYMDVNEVTVGQFRGFVAESGYDYDFDIAWHKTLGTVAKYSPTEKHPMIYVDWRDAVAYSKWAGKRLPTEAEWEYAARGGLVGKRPDGTEASYGREYSWGDEIDGTEANYDKKLGRTSVVGSYKANGYGLYDMAGNVWEWCSDWYGNDYYSKRWHANSTAKNPRGPATGSGRVFRGGSWSSTAFSLRVARRGYHSPYHRSDDLGFRCVS